MALATTTSAAPADEAAPGWEQPSATALTWVTVGAGMLLLGSVLHALTSLQQVSPEALTLGAASSFGRLRPAALLLVTFGGLGMLGTGVALDVVRRLVRVPLRLDSVARAGGALTTLGVVGGAVAIVLGNGTGRPGLDAPRPFAGAIALGLLLAAASALRTISGRADDLLHPALWHLVAALVAGPLLLLLGTVPRPAGVDDEIVRAFTVGGLQLLWLVGLGIGIALYVVPTAARAPLHSRGLAAVGFWGWVMTAPFAGAVRLLLGPSQDWLESVGAAATIALLLPVLAIVVNLFSTYAARTSLAHPAALRLALLGIVLLLLATVLGAVGSLRPVADVVRLTPFTEGVDVLLLLGAGGALLIGGLYHSLPGLTGNRLANPRFAASHTWLLAIGAVLVLVGLCVAGYVQGSLLTAAVKSGTPLATGTGFLVVADAIRPLLVLRLVGDLVLVGVFAAVFQQVFSTSAYADPLPTTTTAAPGSAVARS